MNKRFPVLSSISNMLRIIGWLLMIGGFCLMLYKGIIEPTQLGHEFGKDDQLLVAFGSLFVFIGLVVTALGEIIQVLFAIEENTRISKVVSTRTSTKEPK